MDSNVSEIARSILSNWGFAEYDRPDVKVINKLDLSLLLQVRQDFTTADQQESFEYIQQINTEYLQTKSLTQAQREYLKQCLKSIFKDGIQAKLQAFW